MNHVYSENRRKKIRVKRYKLSFEKFTSHVVSWQRAPEMVETRMGNVPLAIFPDFQRPTIVYRINLVLEMENVLNRNSFSSTYHRNLRASSHQNYNFPFLLLFKIIY